MQNKSMDFKVIYTFKNIQEKNNAINLSKK